GKDQRGTAAGRRKGPKPVRRFTERVKAGGESGPIEAALGRPNSPSRKSSPGPTPIFSGPAVGRPLGPVRSPTRREKPGRRHLPGGSSLAQLLTNHGRLTPATRSGRGRNWTPVKPGWEGALYRSE